MSPITLDFVLRLLGAARYDEVADLVVALQRESVGAGETATAELMRTAGELSLACRDHHAEVDAHWRAASSEAVTETRVRMELAALLEQLAGPDRRLAVGAVEGPRPRRAAAVPLEASGTGTKRHVWGRHGTTVLTIYCLGPLRIYRGEQALGQMPNRRSRSLGKYLLVNREQPTPKEVLMELFWPGATAAAARNNLNVAVFGLRRFLQDADGHDGDVLYQDGCYFLNPSREIWMDLDAFTTCAAAAHRFRRSGDSAAELLELEAAEVLYGGSLFEDDPYEEWSAALRRALQDSYVEVLESLRDRYLDRDDLGGCLGAARKILAVEPAHETTHRELMRCYARLGQRYLALRQYHDCQDVLRAELDVGPSPEVTQLYERIRAHEPV